MPTNPINPDFNSYVRNTDFKGENKTMPNIESTEEANVFYELDEDGNRVRRFTDNDRDGNIDVIANLDADGKVTDEIIDENGDGKADLHVTYDYDEKGNEIARHIDTDMDGTVDVVQYVDQNAVIYSDDIDVDDNGSVDLHVNYIYDEAGNEYRSIDYNKDGKADEITTVSNGEIVAEEFDTDRNGTLDTHVEYAHDEDGNESITAYKEMKPIKGDLPEGWVVENGKILNESGEEVGMVVTEARDDGIVKTYFEFLE